MNTKAILIAVLLGFAALTAQSIFKVGYLGIWRAGIANMGALQILVDLSIVCSLFAVWLFKDAQQHGVNPWPFAVVTLFAGSFGPLLYLLWRRNAGRTA